MGIGTANIKFSDIQTEYGGSNPVSMSEYYRNGSNVPNGPVPGAANTTGNISVSVSSTSSTGNIPTSGQISTANFKNSSTVATITVTITGDVFNLDLLTTIKNYLGTVNNAISCTCTINSGINVYSTSTATPAFSTGTSWAAGSSLSIINNGYIIGKGGDGGNGGATTGSAGSAGGHALSLGLNTSITNASGFIYGGGGGGGGGGGAYYGGYYSGGGGGGGGRSYSASSGGIQAGYVLYGTLGYNGIAGTSGTFAGAGTGGYGAYQYYISGENTNNEYGGTGGDGGDWGTVGNTGNTASAEGLFTAYGGGSGGAAGKAINLNGFTATFVSGNDSTHVKGAQS